MRPSQKRHGHLWEFPGGKVHEHEDDRMALVRELEEELGLEVVDSGRPVFEARDPNSPFTIAFSFVTVMGHPLPHEHEEVRWADLAELKRLPMAPADRRFIDEFLARFE